MTRKNILIFILVFLAGVEAGIFLFGNLFPRLQLLFLKSQKPVLSYSPLLKEKMPVFCQKIKKGKGIEVNIDKQTLRLCENGRVKKEFIVSTGKKETPTPEGEFRVIKKSTMIYFKTSGYWLPFWVGFYGDFGLHEVPISDKGQRIGEEDIGRPASSGCVRLNLGDAEKVYKFSQIGMKVVIFKESEEK